MTSSKLSCLAPCSPAQLSGLPCVCGPEVCQAGQLCGSEGCGVPCDNPALQPHLNIRQNSSDLKLTGTVNFTCSQGFSIFLGEVRSDLDCFPPSGKFSSQAGKTAEFSATCHTGKTDSHWLVGGTPTQIACQDSRTCHQPPPHSDLLATDFDHFKIEPGDTFSLFCPSKQKS